MSDPTEKRKLVAIMFTDVVGSTALKQQLGDKAGLQIIQEHHELVRQTLRGFAGAREVETAGDSFFLTFPAPSAAVIFALVLQERLRRFNRSRAVPVQDRVGIHSGEVSLLTVEAGLKPGGLHVDLCARVMSLAQGGQILMTRFVFDHARQSLKGEEIAGVGTMHWLNHGAFRLKGIDESVEICEVRSAEATPVAPPTNSDKAERVSGEGEPVLGWRPAVGQVVGRTDWVLEKQLGQGGFGEVWIGRHRKLKERRVFKFCFRADRVRSLKREMTLFRLIKERIGDHPNIVSLREVYFDEPPYYVEMDYAEGQDLASWCAAQGGADKVALETKLEIVAQVAEALQAAHECGVVHRDVKPGNILVSNPKSEIGAGSAPSTDSQPSTINYQPPVKLTDFGIGQVISAEVLAGVTRAGFTQTMLGSTSSQTGTQLYMAPELIAGKPTSTRSDIYSLGVVLYQLLVGDFSRPVTGDWLEEVVDPLLRDDLRHCLAGRPKDRFTAAGQLANNLRAWDHRKLQVARKQAEEAERERLRAQAERRRKLLLAGSMVALVLIVLALAFGYGMRKAQAERERQRRFAYDADMNLASQALQQHDRGRIRRLLNRHRPAQASQPDLRGWEWRYLWEECRSDELATIGQHDGYVPSVAVSPDGTWVASGGWDGLLKIWSLTSGAVGGRGVTNLQLAGGPVSSVAFSPNGRWLAARTWTNGAVVFRAPGWQREMAATNSEAAPFGGSLAFSADSRFLAVGGEVWSLDTRSRLRTVPCRQYDQGDPGIAWLPNSVTLAGFAKSDDLYRVSFFDVGSANLDATVSMIPFRAKPDSMPYPTTLAFSPDAKFLAIGSWDDVVRIHAARDGRQVMELTNHTGWISSLAFSPNGHWLASASADHSIRIWRTRDWQEMTALRGHEDEVWAVAFTPDGQQLVTGSKDRSVRLWPLVRPSRHTEVLSVSAEGTTRFSLSGACPFGVGPSNVLSVLDARTLEVRQRISNYPIPNVLAPLPSPDGRWLLLMTTEGGLWLTDLGPGARPPAVCLRTNGTPCEAAAFSARTKWLAVADGATLQVWDLKHEAQRPGLVLAVGRFWGLRFSPDERLLGAITGPIYSNRSVVVWDPATGRQIARFQSHLDNVTDFDFSPDGAVVATVSWDNTCRLFDLRRRQPITTLYGDLGGLHSVCFSADGRRLAAGMGRGCVKIWDLATSRDVLVLNEAGSSSSVVAAVRFHPGGDSLLSIDGTGLRLFRAPSWAEIQTADKADGAAQRR